MRYGLLEPERSDGGQRLYSDADIERLRLVQRALQAGRRIGQVAGLAEADLERLVAEDEEARRGEPEAAPARARPEWEHQRYLDACIAAVQQFDDRRLERELSRAGIALEARDLLDHVLAPLLIWLGEGWVAGRITPGHERLATAVIRRQLNELTSMLHVEDGPVMVTTTPSGQRHELGAMLAAAAAATEGWHVIYLGAELPAESIAKATVATGARAVALSLIYPPDDDASRSELRELRRLLPAGTEIIVGGRASGSYATVLEEIGAIWLSETASMRSALDLVRISGSDEDQ